MTKELPLSNDDRLVDATEEEADEKEEEQKNEEEERDEIED